MGVIVIDVVTFGQVLTMLRSRGDVAQADRMLRDVTLMAITIAKQVGLGSIMPSVEKIQEDLITQPMDNVLMLIKVYKQQNKPVVASQPVRSTTVKSRMDELRARGFYVKVGVDF